MRKMFVVCLVLLGFVLTGCTDEPLNCETGTHEEEGICVLDEVEEVVCTDNQIKVDQECVNLTGPEIQLRDAIENTNDITTYRLMNHIIQGELDYLIEIVIDENVSRISYDMGRSREYFRYNSDGTCDHMTFFNDVSQTDSVDCSSLTDYTFFKQLEYTWFHLVSGKYEVKEEYSSQIDRLFDSFYDDFELGNFTLSVADGFISEIDYTITMNEVTYQITMDIRAIDEIGVIFGGVSE